MLPPSSSCHRRLFPILKGKRGERAEGAVRAPDQSPLVWKRQNSDFNTGKTHRLIVCVPISSNIHRDPICASPVCGERRGRSVCATGMPAPDGTNWPILSPLASLSRRRVMRCGRRVESKSLRQIAAFMCRAQRVGGAAVETAAFTTTSTTLSQHCLLIFAKKVVSSRLGKLFGRRSKSEKCNSIQPQIKELSLVLHPENNRKRRFVKGATVIL